MKEKLIELLQNAPSDFEGNKNVSTLADYLLANGVIVTPCMDKYEKRRDTNDR